MKELYRVWDKRKNKFVKLGGSGRYYQLMFMGKTHGWEVVNDNDNISKDNFVIQRWTGLKDKNNKDVYEGDFVKFQYYVGDFAWEFMDEEERKWNRKECGKIYVGLVCRDLLSSNLTFKVCWNNGVTSYYPLTYCGGTTAEIIGNNFQNPELS